MTSEERLRRQHEYLRRLEELNAEFWDAFDDDQPEPDSPSDPE